MAEVNHFYKENHVESVYKLKQIQINLSLFKILIKNLIALNVKKGLPSIGKKSES